MKKVESKNLKNKTEGYYPQRRQVMKYIYEAKNIAQRFGIHHQRIEVRITENQDCILGQATINSNKKYIWITEEGLNRSDLRITVFHEILHTLYNQEHVKGCKLMNDTSTAGNISDQEITDIFIRYITKCN